MDNRVTIFSDTPGGPVRITPQPIKVSTVPRVDESFVFERNRYKVQTIVHDLDIGVIGIVGRLNQ